MKLILNLIRDWRATFCVRSQLIGACDSQYYITNIMLKSLCSPNEIVLVVLSSQHNVALYKLGTKKY